MLPVRRQFTVRRNIGNAYFVLIEESFDTQADFKKVVLFKQQGRQSRMDRRGKGLA